MAEEYLTDDEQWEAVKHWTTENGAWVVGGIVIGTALLFGWRYYDNYRNQRALHAAAEFGQMTNALDHNDRDGTRRIAEGIVKNYAGSPYADQAQLSLARLFVDEGKPAEALAPLLLVMNGSKDDELRNVARLRVARIQIDQGKPDEAIKTLADDKSPAFAANFHEVRGDALLAKQDPKGAAAEYQAALGSGDTRGTDMALLQLKLADLGVSPATTVNKDKP
jgi:predicted negative regulator of RcsB-dependent stress response